MVGPVDCGVLLKGLRTTFPSSASTCWEVFNLEQIVVWTPATTVVGPVQVGAGAACQLTDSFIWSGNPGSWYGLGKLYEPL